MINYIPIKFSYDVETLREYFLNKIIPNLVNTGQYATKNLVPFIHDVQQDPVIEQLNQFLMSNFNTPPIQSYCLFYFSNPVPIHIDGRGGEEFRHANLNLPLSGWHNNTMCFYTENSGHAPTWNSIDKIILCDANQVTLYEQFETTEDWVLVRVDQPHNITNIDFDNPRITLSIKFKTNPSFEYLEKCFATVQEKHAS
jgi:hypothetical protein